MTPFAWGLLAGVIVGASLGLLLFALMTTAKQADTHPNPDSQRQAEDEQRVWHNVNRKEEPHGQDRQAPHEAHSPTRARGRHR